MAKGKFQILAVIGVAALNMAKDLKKAGGNLTGWAKRTTQAVLSIAFKGTAAAGAAIAAFGVASLKEFASFEKGMLEVFTLLPGISKQAMSKMEDDVLSLSQKMGILPEEVVPALYQALSAGIPAKNVFSFLETAGKSAMGGVASLTESVSVLTSVTNAYGPENLSAADAADILFTTVAKGVTNFGELAGSLYNVVPSAAAAGVSFEQVGAAIAALTKAGTPTAVATTQIRQAILAMMAPNTAMAKGFEKSGMSVGRLAEIMKQPGGLLTAMQMVIQVADGDTTALKKMMGSVQGLQALLTITANSGQGFVKLLDDFAARAGANQTAFQQMDKGISRSWERISASMKVAMIKAGKAIAPFAEAAVPTILRIIEMIESIPWTKMLQGFARVWLIGIRPHLQELARTLLELPWGNLLITLRPVAEIIIKTIQRLIKIAIALAPAIVPGIGALGFLFVLMHKGFFTLVAMVTKLAPSLGLIFKDVFEIMRTAFLFFMNPTKANFKAFMTFTKTKLKDLWKHIKFFGEDMAKLAHEMWWKFKFIMINIFGKMFEEAKRKFKEFLQNIPGWNTLATLWKDNWIIVKEELLKAWVDLKKGLKELGIDLDKNMSDSEEMKKASRELVAVIFEFVAAVIYLAIMLMKLFGVIVALANEFDKQDGQQKKAKKSTSALAGVMEVLYDILKIIVKGITGVVAALGWVIEKITSFKDAMIETIKAGKMFSEIFEVYLDEISKAVDQAVNKIIRSFVNAGKYITDAFESILPGFKKMLDDIGEWVYELLWGGTITKDFKTAFDFIEKVVMKVLNAIKDVFDSVFKGIKMGIDGLKTAFQSLGDFVSKIFEKILKVGERAMDLAKGVLKGAGKVFGDLFGGGDKKGASVGRGGGAKARPASTGAGNAITPLSLNTSLKPIVAALTSMDGSLKSIDKTLKGKFVNQ